MEFTKVFVTLVAVVIEEILQLVKQLMLEE